MMTERLADMHVHSDASDGSFTPREVADLAIEAQLSAMALTDHDTVDGLTEIMEYTADKAIEVIPGVELSAYYKNREVHILGYYMDYTNEGLRRELDAMKKARLERNLKMIDLMQADGLPVTLEKLLHGNPDSVITRAHFARVLVEEGICRDKNQAFAKYIGIGCKYYLPKANMPAEKAMNIIAEYGKAAYLAHPLLYHFGYAQIEELLDYLKGYGLKGLEAYHSSNNRYESEKLSAIARKHGLKVSGGTDFHGVVKPNIKIGVGRGTMRIPYSFVEELKSCCQMN